MLCTIKSNITICPLMCYDRHKNYCLLISLYECNDILKLWLQIQNCIKISKPIKLKEVFKQVKKEVDEKSELDCGKFLFYKHCGALHLSRSQNT